MKKKMAIRSSCPKLVIMTFTCSTDMCINMRPTNHVWWSWWEAFGLWVCISGCAAGWLCWFVHCHYHALLFCAERRPESFSLCHKLLDCEERIVISARRHMRSHCFLAEICNILLLLRRLSKVGHHASNHSLCGSAGNNILLKSKLTVQWWAYKWAQIWATVWTAHVNKAIKRLHSQTKYIVNLAAKLQNAKMH